MHRWLAIRLEAPLISFGGVMIDAISDTRDFPSASMITGLLANALGYQRTQYQAHQQLQDRLVFGVRDEGEKFNSKLLDVQNAKIAQKDKGWTSWGVPESRYGGGNTYNSPHRRYRSYRTDANLSLVLRLQDATQAPTLDDLAHALDYPARPIFVGRKSCIPSAPLRIGFVEATTAYGALKHPLATVNPKPQQNLPALWPLGEGPDHGDDCNKIIYLADLRNWKSGLHGGQRSVVLGSVRIAGGMG
ncbi:MAG: type I-E CRISPR-associated protein Cas5/CasD [Magnetococcales bacterium]|nr:type I-E CRISPR-associated protein Cas5/CasD [Magnetococcales bacterium]